MAKVIDLGNGYGRIEKYRSKYASLTFPLTPYKILRLYSGGYLDRNEAEQVLLDMGYSHSWISWRLAIADVNVAEREFRLANARTI